MKSILIGIAFLCLFVTTIHAVIDKPFFSYSPAIIYNVSNKVSNKWYQLSTQRSGVAAFIITVTTTSSLLAGATGQVLFETAVDTLSTITVLTSGQSGLAAGLVNPGTSGFVTVYGAVNRNQWFRVRTNNLAGTPSYSVMNGVEALIQ